MFQSFLLGVPLMALQQKISFELFPPRTPEGVAKLPA
jgi:5,10-methylenetetrahydrofolate reductase